MASKIMSTIIVALSLAFALAGVGHAQVLNKDCSMDQVQIMSKVVTCLTKEHPEYLLTVLTKMNNPAEMESSEFMCSHPDMMASLTECGLQYLEGCMPPAIARQVTGLMPSKATVMKGVRLLCEHRKDFEDSCVTSQIVNLMTCFNNKMKAFQTVSVYGSANMQGALCRALASEEQCLSTNLRGCRKEVTSNIMSSLLAFFPADKCHFKKTDETLRFKPGAVIH